MYGFVFSSWNDTCGYKGVNLFVILKALQVLVDQSKKANSPLKGHERTVQYLQHLGEWERCFCEVLCLLGLVIILLFSNLLETYQVKEYPCNLVSRVMQASRISP